jgi:hypothetical protein
MAGVFDNGSLSFYLDGALKATATATASTVKTVASTPFKLAGFNSSNAYVFNGDIAQVRLYSAKALTAQEVAQNYNAQRGQF